MSVSQVGSQPEPFRTEGGGIYFCLSETEAASAEAQQQVWSGEMLKCEEIGRWSKQINRWGKRSMVRVQKTVTSSKQGY